MLNSSIFSEDALCGFIQEVYSFIFLYCVFFFSSIVETRKTYLQLASNLMNDLPRSFLECDAELVTSQLEILVGSAYPVRAKGVDPEEIALLSRLLINMGDAHIHFTLNEAIRIILREVSAPRPNT